MVGRWAVRGFIVLLAVATGGCPDPEGGYNEYLDRTEDMRATASDVPLEGGGAFDFSGTHLLAVNTSVMRGCPLMFLATVTVEGETVDISLQPLRTDFTDPGCPPGAGERADARTAVGDALLFADLPYTDGTFVISQDGIAIPGEANPITFSDIVANLTLNGVVRSEDDFCGTVAGQVLQPVELDLTGSTFGAIRTEDPTTVDPVPLACPEGNGTGNGTGS